MSRMGLIRSLLENQGIETVVERSNELDVLAIPTLTPPRLDPVLYVVNEEDYEKAATILQEYFQSEEVNSRKEVPCSFCGAMNPGNFEICWSCGKNVRG